MLESRPRLQRRDSKEAIRQQLDKLSNANILSYDRPAQVTIDYARALRDAIGSPALRYVRLGNTGSQMTETAIMLSRLARAIGGESDRNTAVIFEPQLGQPGESPMIFVRSPACAGTPACT